MTIKNPVTRVFQLLLLLSPIAVGADIDLEMFDIIFFRTGVIILFMVSLIDTPKRTMPQFMNRIVFGLLGLCIYNIFINTFAPVTMMATMNIFLFIIGLYVVYVYLNEKSKLIKYILLAGLINLVFYVAQRFGFNPVFEMLPKKGNEDIFYYAGAFLGNAPRLGTYFTLIIPFMPLYLLPLAIVAMVMLKQYIMAIPIILLVLLNVNNAMRIAVGILSVGTILFFKNHIIASFIMRFQYVLKPGLQFFFDRPMIGYGLGADIDNRFSIFCISFMQFMLATGLIGLVWTGYSLKQIYKKISLNIESIALISFLVALFLEYPLEIVRLRYLIMAIIVMFLIKQNIGIQDLSMNKEVT